MIYAFLESSNGPFCAPKIFNVYMQNRSISKIITLKQPILEQNQAKSFLPPDRVHAGPLLLEDVLHHVETHLSYLAYVL